MATATPLTHPNEAVQNRQFFPWRVSVVKLNSTTGASEAVAGLSALPATYSPAQGGETIGLEAQESTVDKILILGWYPAIRSKQRVLLLRPDGSTEGVFIIDDRVPADATPSRTLLTVTPDR